MKHRLLTNILVDLTPSTAYSRGVLVGVASYCREHGSVEMLPVHNDPALLGEPERVDGVIAAIDDAAAYSAAERSPVPVVNISSVLDDLPSPTVCVDSTAVGRLAAEYMLQQGYAHFACHVESRIAFSRLSLTGFADRLTEAGHACAKFDTGADNVAGIAPAGVRSATAAWLHELPKPVGVFTHSDVRAASILKICLEAGIDVPNEAGIIGNDNDLIIGPATKPTLTSIDNAPELVGYRAASVLVDLIRGEPPRHNRELVPPRSVIERQSTQPAFVADESLRQAMRFIRAHAADAITVDDVVRHVPLSRRTLERRFQSHLARSPADEIRRVHFERARHLLAETSLKLSEVAIASGYSRFSSFATAFQAAHERTPSEYRVAFRTR